MPHNPASIVRLLYGECTVEEKTAPPSSLAALPSFRGSDSIFAGSSEFLAHEKLPPKISNARTVLSPSTALTVANGTGDGLDIPIAGNEGIYISGAGGDGIIANGNFFGGYFNGPYGGSYSQNNTDNNFSVGAYGYEFGTTAETFGLSGYSASKLGVGTYGQAVSASTEGGTWTGPFGVWGDSGARLRFVRVIRQRFRRGGHQQQPLRLRRGVL